jgi:hypothetical protein
MLSAVSPDHRRRMVLTQKESPNYKNGIRWKCAKKLLLEMPGASPSHYYSKPLYRRSS